MPSNPTPSRPPNPSPCRKRCELDQRGVCRGCGRTLHEISLWSRAPESLRATIAQAARHRLAKAP
ncbi:DUF1289 domain-containing protein [Pelagicoccus sp. NFK12]|uniref:DUF1289 domain-containing protein n=1 Tax=Pelagicoccus enzymogenes TaxID=2773457 RepID=A0A927FCV8_9BACT|nr:DUF1289 domain-containing protein [Pelagicoccus enzymogenes]MBD5782035.1 DUF1289 domain-containing protein [Pelagicoccus enzymogenes]